MTEPTTTDFRLAKRREALEVFQAEPQRELTCTELAKAIRCSRSIATQTLRSLETALTITSRLVVSPHRGGLGRRRRFYRLHRRVAAAPRLA